MGAHPYFKSFFNAGPRTVATARPRRSVRQIPVDYRKTTFEGFVSSVNVALDTIGRDAQVIENEGVSAGYFYVGVTTGRLNKRTDLLTDQRSKECSLKCPAARPYASQHRAANRIVNLNAYGLD